MVDIPQELMAAASCTLKNNDWIFDPFLNRVRSEFLDCSIKDGNVPFKVDGTWFHWKPKYYYSNHAETLACKKEVYNFDSRIVTEVVKVQQELLNCIVQRSIAQSDLCSCDQSGWTKLERLRRGPQFVVRLFSNDQNAIQNETFTPDSLCGGDSVAGKFCMQDSDCSGTKCKEVYKSQLHISANNLVRN